MLIFLLTVILYLSAILIPFVWGRGPERQGAKVVAVMFLLSVLRSFLFGTRLDGLDYIGFLIDLIGFVGFLVIALFALRVWPLWAAALQLIAVTAHLVTILDIQIHPTAYSLMRFAPSYLVSVTLLTACIQLKRTGSANDNTSCWRVWSGQSILGAPRR